MTGPIFEGEDETIDCEACGGDLVSTRDDGLYEDEQAITCDDCRAVNHVSVDEDGDAWVSSWTCVHGVTGDEKCTPCEVVGR